MITINRKATSKQTHFEALVMAITEMVKKATPGFDVQFTFSVAQLSDDPHGFAVVLRWFFEDDGEANGVCIFGFDTREHAAKWLTEFEAYRDRHIGDALKNRWWSN